jgi:hypothetical protein
MTKSNNLIGFEITVELTEAEASKYGVNLETLSDLASWAIKSKVPSVKIKQTGLLNTAKPKQVAVWNSKNKTLLVNEREVYLTKMEEVILHRLAKTPNDYVSYPELVSILETEVREITAPNHLRVVMHRLRNKLGFDRNIIRTDRQAGYSLRTNDERLAII